MIVVAGESFEVKRIVRKQNSAFEWENVADITFYGRPADTSEKKQYRIQQGVQGSQESLYLITSNLPTDVKVGDKILFNGSIYTIVSTGYYFNNTRIVNNHIMSNRYITERCPKGIVLS